MGISSGPNTFERGLSFGFDTGHGESDNATPTRYYKGEHTTNHIPNIGISTSNWSEYGWLGDFEISSDYENTFELTATNGWHNTTYNFGVSSGGSIYVKFEYMIKTHQTSQYQIFVLNGTHLGSYTNFIGSGQQSYEWQTFSGSFNANGDTKFAIGLRGADGSGLTDVTYIRNLQVEQKTHGTPFVNGTRDTNTSLIDLTHTTNIDTSNVSFDSTGQPVFDGTDDNIILEPSTKWAIGQDGTIEMMVKPTNSTGNDRLWCVDNNSTSLDAYLNGTTYNVYLHGGVVGTNTPLILNSWNYLVVTYSGGEIQIYINGSEAVMNGNTTGYNITNAGTLFLGSFPNPPHNLYGSVGFFKLHKGSITFEEVKQNYNSQKNRFDI